MSEWNIGVDVVEVDRFRSLDYSSHKRFYERIFTPREIEYCLSFDRPAPHFAVNFAGKEAVYKAVNRFCDVRLRDIEILRDVNGAPLVSLHLNRKEAAKDGGYEISSLLEVRVSLSHSSSHAVAFAVVNLPQINMEPKPKNSLGIAKWAPITDLKRKPRDRSIRS